MSLVTRLISSLVLLSALCSGAVVQNDLPTPLFDGRADVDSFDDFGSGAATCTPSNVSFVEDPASSGLYAADFNGTTSVIDCGTGLDGLALGGTWLGYIQPDTSGEGGAGNVYHKATDASNRSWALLVGNTGTACATNNCYQWQNVSTPGNVGHPHSTPGASVVLAGAYQHVAFSVVCTGTTVQSCDAGTRAYLDGFPVTTTHIANSGDARTADSSDSFLIGNRPANDRTFDGKIKRTVVFSQALNALQIEASYYRTLALDTPEVAEDFALLPCNNEVAWTAAGYESSPFDLNGDTAMIGDFCDPFGEGERPTERTETAVP